MLTWLAAHWIDILLVLAVLAAVTLAIMKILKDKKAGRSSCGCNCGSCAMAGKCKSLCVSNAFTGLSGCLLAQSQKSVNIDIGSGMVTIALASLLIGGTFIRSRRMGLRIVGTVIGAFIFRLVYTIALRFNMPAYMLKLVSSVIVIIAISGPYIKSRFPEFARRLEKRKC